jgi:hypothetical protein
VKLAGVPLCCVTAALTISGYSTDAAPAYGLEAKSSGSGPAMGTSQ